MDAPTLVRVSAVSFDELRQPLVILTNIAGDKQLFVVITRGEDYHLIKGVREKNLRSGQEKFFAAFEMTHGKVYQTIIEDPCLRLGHIYYRRDAGSAGDAETRLGQAIALALYFGAAMYLAAEVARRMSARKSDSQPEGNRSPEDLSSPSDPEFSAWLDRPDTTPAAFRRFEDKANGRGNG